MCPRTQSLDLIEFKCPCCESGLAFSASRAGTAQECPVCFKVVVVPERSSDRGGILPVPIRTERLRIRFLKTEDQPDWLEFISDEGSYDYLESYAPDEEQARAWLARSKAVKLTDPGGCIALGVELQEPVKIIGMLSLHLYASEADEANNRQGGFQIMINPRFRSRGYGTEAVGGLLRFAFEAICLHDVRVGIDSRNAAARRMVEKAGLRLEGEFQEDKYVKDSWASTAWYGLLNKEYAAQTKNAGAMV